MPVPSNAWAQGRFITASDIQVSAAYSHQKNFKNVHLLKAFSPAPGITTTGQVPIFELPIEFSARRFLGQHAIADWQITHLKLLRCRRVVEPAIRPSDPGFPKIDFVLISHNHYDHLDTASVKELHTRFGDDLAWYVPLKLGAWFTSLGVKNVTELDWWQDVQHPGSQVTVIMTPAQVHRTGRSL